MSLSRLDKLAKKPESWPKQQSSFRLRDTTPLGLAERERVICRYVLASSTELTELNAMHLECILPIWPRHLREVCLSNPFKPPPSSQLMDGLSRNVYLHLVRVLATNRPDEREGNNCKNLQQTEREKASFFENIVGQNQKLFWPF